MSCVSLLVVTIGFFNETELTVNEGDSIQLCVGHLDFDHMKYRRISAGYSLSTKNGTARGKQVKASAILLNG